MLCSKDQKPLTHATTLEQIQKISVQVISIIYCKYNREKYLVSQTASRNLEISLPVVLTPVQNSLTHTVDILLTLVLALTHVYIAYHLFPASNNVQTLQLLLQQLLLSNVLLSPLLLLLLLSAPKLLQLPTTLGFALALLVPLFLLGYHITTLFSWRRV